ncbi:hypothetical protein [Rahnella sp. CFA14(1/10)]|uniref:hypothetical protein n=1 Tax=Rahnella sp. CFA14(1/10) TaxID=2511203 RepID=UPI0010206D2A|nr:hypothetical protein [Rahnella sp. CFA14(1/10)]
MAEKTKAELRTDYLMANTSYVESVTDDLLVTDIVALQKDLNSLTAFVDAYGSNDKSDAQLKDSIDNIKSLMNAEG